MDGYVVCSRLMECKSSPQTIPKGDSMVRAKLMEQRLETAHAYRRAELLLAASVISEQMQMIRFRKRWSNMMNELYLPECYWGVL